MDVDKLMLILTRNIDPSECDYQLTYSTRHLPSLSGHANLSPCGEQENLPYQRSGDDIRDRFTCIAHRNA